MEEGDDILVGGTPKMHALDPQLTRVEECGLAVLSHRGHDVCDEVIMP
jgi:hypothetical protein